MNLLLPVYKSTTDLAEVTYVYLSFLKLVKTLSSCVYGNKLLNNIFHPLVFACVWRKEN